MALRARLTVTILVITTSGAAGAEGNAVPAAASDPAPVASSSPKGEPSPTSEPPPTTNVVPTTSPMAPSGDPYANPAPCSAGSVYYAGRCISLCNPPCPAGELCTEQRTCVAKQAAAQAAGDSASAAEVDRHTDEDLADTPSMRHRLAHRNLPRFTLQSAMQFSLPKNGDLVALGLAAAIGYRQNFTQAFGLHLRLGASVGLLTPAQDRQDDTSGYEDPYPRRNDTCTMTQLYGELVPFFGPFGRVYFGPLIWVGHFSYDSNALRAYDINGALAGSYPLASEWLLGPGFEGGVLLLRREQLDINWRTKSTLTKSLPMGFEAGLAYHFM